MLFPTGIGKSTKYLRYRRAGFTLLPTYLFGDEVSRARGGGCLSARLVRISARLVCLSTRLVRLSARMELRHNLCRGLVPLSHHLQVFGITALSISNSRVRLFDISVFCHCVKDDDKKSEKRVKIPFPKSHNYLYPDQDLQNFFF